MNLQFATPKKNLYPLKTEIQQEKIYKDYLTVPFNKGHHIIKFSKILYLRSESSYTLIYLENGKKILSSKTLKSFTDLLPSHLFMRVHRSYIIPLSRVDAIYNSPSAVLVYEQQIPVSKNYRGELKEYFL